MATEQVNTLTIGAPIICPTCKLAIHVRPWGYGMVIEGAIGTFSGGHGHVICPCGWWTETAGNDDSSGIADAHARLHLGGDE